MVSVPPVFKLNVPLPFAEPSRRFATLSAAGVVGGGRAVHHFKG